MIINEEELLEDCINLLVDHLGWTKENAKDKLTPNEIGNIINKMYEAQEKYLEELL